MFLLSSFIMEGISLSIGFGGDFMKKIKEKGKLEYLFYLFLIISPFLDAFSYWFRKVRPDAIISPTTILRLVIPFLLLLFIFIKERKWRGELLILGFTYFLYACSHLYCYQRFLTDSAYGSVFHEAQYVLNYTYMMIVLCFCFYFVKRENLSTLYRSITWFLAIYVFLLYLALLTGTSSSTYIDGVGYKGWNASGNALGSLLLISLILLLPYFFSKKKWYHFLILLLTGIYLMVFLGTRVGLFGFPIVLVSYFLCVLLGKTTKHKKVISKRKLFLSLAVFSCFLIGSIFLISHSSTLKRQTNLEKEQNQVIDQKTQEVSHITGDALAYVREIENGQMDKAFMDFAQQKSLLEMKEAASKLQLSNSNRRVQQLLYHTYLIKNQKSFSRILLGNGYLANYSEMTLEMELASLLYNFGLIGFVLYLGAFIILEVKALSFFLHHFDKRNSTYLFYLFGVAFVYALSLMAGYTFFHVSCMVVIVLLHVLLHLEQEKIQMLHS